MASTWEASTIGLALLAAADVPAMISAACPSFMTISRFSGDDHDVAVLRQGEVLGAGLGLMLAAGASLAAHSWLPIIAAGVVAVIYTYMIEWHIAHPHPSAAPIDAQTNGNGY